MSNPFEQLETAEDFNNFFLALVGDAVDKGIELHIFHEDSFDCVAYNDDILDGVRFI